MTNKFSDSSYKILNDYFSVIKAARSLSDNSYITSQKRGIYADGGIYTILYQENEEGDFIGYRFIIQDIDGNNFRFLYVGVESSHSGVTDLQVGERMWFRKDSFFHDWLINNPNASVEFEDFVNVNKSFIYFGEILSITDATNEYNIEFRGLKDWTVEALPENNRTERMQDFLEVYFDRVYHLIYNLTKTLWSMIDPKEVNIDHIDYLATRANIVTDKDKIGGLLLREMVDQLIYWLKRKGTYTSYIAVYKMILGGTRNKLNIFEKWCEWCLTELRKSENWLLDRDFDEHHVLEHYGQYPSGGSGPEYYGKFQVADYPTHTSLATAPKPSGCVTATRAMCGDLVDYTNDSVGWGQIVDEQAVLTFDNYSLDIDGFNTGINDTADVAVYGTTAISASPTLGLLDKPKHCFRVYMDSTARPSGGVLVWGVTNDDGIEEFSSGNRSTGSRDWLGMTYELHGRLPASATPVLKLWQQVPSGTFVDTTTVPLQKDETYYITISRQITQGGYHALFANIYPNPSHKSTDLIEQLRLNLKGDAVYRNNWKYIYGLGTHRSAAGMPSASFVGEVSFLRESFGTVETLGTTGYKVITPHIRVELDLSTEPMGEDYIISQNQAEELVRYWEYLKPVSKFVDYNWLISPIGKIDDEQEAVPLYSVSDTAFMNTQFVGQSFTSAAPDPSGAGPDGDFYDVTYKEIRQVASNEWSTFHGLGSKELIIQSYDKDDLQVWPVNYEFPDDNRIVADWVGNKRGKTLIAGLKPWNHAHEQIIPASGWTVTHNMGTSGASGVAFHVVSVSGAANLDWTGATEVDTHFNIGSSAAAGWTSYMGPTYWVPIPHTGSLFNKNLSGTASEVTLTGKKRFDFIDLAIDSSSYLYWDFGSGYFNDFEIQFQGDIYCETAAGGTPETLAPVAMVVIPSVEYSRWEGYIPSGSDSTAYIGNGNVNEGIGLNSGMAVDDDYVYSGTGNELNTFSWDLNADGENKFTPLDTTAGGGSGSVIDIKVYDIPDSTSKRVITANSSGGVKAWAVNNSGIITYTGADLPANMTQVETIDLYQPSDGYCWTNWYFQAVYTSFGFANTANIVDGDESTQGGIYSGPAAGRYLEVWAAYSLLYGLFYPGADIAAVEVRLKLKQPYQTAGTTHTMKMIYDITGTHDYGDTIDLEPYDFDATSGEWSDEKVGGWWDITDDTNSPGAGNWTWNDLDNIGVRFDYTLDQAFHFDYIYKVEIRVKFENTDAAYIFATNGGNGLYAICWDGLYFSELSRDDQSGYYEGVYYDGTYVYAPVSTGGVGVRAHSWNESTGKLTFLGNSGGPAAWKIDGDGTFIYVADDDGIHSYTYNGSSFTEKGEILAGGWDSRDVTVGKYVYSTWAYDGFKAHSVDENGAFSLEYEEDGGDWYYDKLDTYYEDAITVGEQGGVGLVSLSNSLGTYTTLDGSQTAVKVEAAPNQGVRELRYTLTTENQTTSAALDVLRENDASRTVYYTLSRHNQDTYLDAWLTSDRTGSVITGDGLSSHTLYVTGDQTAYQYLLPFQALGGTGSDEVSGSTENWSVSGFGFKWDADRSIYYTDGTDQTTALQPAGSWTDNFTAQAMRLTFTTSAGAPAGSNWRLFDSDNDRIVYTDSPTTGQNISTQNYPAGTNYRNGDYWKTNSWSDNYNDINTLTWNLSAGSSLTETSYQLRDIEFYSVPISAGSVLIEFDRMPRNAGSYVKIDKIFSQNGEVQFDFAIPSASVAMGRVFDSFAVKRFANGTDGGECSICTLSNELGNIRSMTDLIVEEYTADYLYWEDDGSPNWTWITSAGGSQGGFWRSPDDSSTGNMQFDTQSSGRHWETGGFYGQWYDGYRPSRMRIYYTGDDLPSDIKLMDSSSRIIASASNYVSGEDIVCRFYDDTGFSNISELLWVKKATDSSWDVTRIEFLVSGGRTEGGLALNVGYHKPDDYPTSPSGMYMFLTDYGKGGATDSWDMGSTPYGGVKKLSGNNYVVSAGHLYVTLRKYGEDGATAKIFTDSNRLNEVHELSLPSLTSETAEATTYLYGLQAMYDQTAYNTQDQNLVISGYTRNFVQIFRDPPKTIWPITAHDTKLPGANNFGNQLELTFAEKVAGNVYVRDDDYFHQQTTPSVTWNIGHNLNSYGQIVMCYDHQNNLIFPSNVLLSSRNDTICTFSEEVSGTAVLITFKSDIDLDSTTSLFGDVDTGVKGYWKIGDGGLDTYFDPAENNDVNSMLTSGALKTQTTTSSAASATILIEFDIPAEGAYTLNEMGVFDKDKNLHYYTKNSSLHKPDGVELHVIYRIRKE